MFVFRVAASPSLPLWKAAVKLRGCSYKTFHRCMKIQKSNTVNWTWLLWRKWYRNKNHCRILWAFCWHSGTPAEMLLLCCWFLCFTFIRCFTDFFDWRSFGGGTLRGSAAMGMEPGRELSRTEPSNESHWAGQSGNACTLSSVMGKTHEWSSSLAGRKGAVHLSRCFFAGFCSALQHKHRQQQSKKEAHQCYSALKLLFPDHLLCQVYWPALFISSSAWWGQLSILFPTRAASLQEQPFH